MLVSLMVIVAVFVLVKFPEKPLLPIILLAFFLPFERIPTIELSGFTLKINHLVGISFIFFWIFQKIYGDRKSSPNPLATNLILLVGSLVLSTLNSQFTSRSVVFVVLSIFTIMIAVGVIDVVSDFKDYKKIEKAITVSTWIVVLFSLWQFGGDLIGLPLSVTGLIEGYSKITFGFPRVQAFSKEPLYLGNFLLLPIGLVASRIIAQRQNKFDKLLLFLLIIVFFMTLSRGAILGLLVFFAIIILAYPKKILTKKYIIPAVVALCSAFAVVILIIGSLGNDFQSKFIEHLTMQNYQKSESSVSRIAWAGDAIEAWKTHPLIGIGMGNFGGFQVNYEINNPRSQDIVNNQYLELLAENGIIGLGLFLMIIVTLLTRSKLAFASTNNDSKRALIICLSASFMAMMVQYNFFSTLSIIHIWFTIGLLCVVQNIIIKNAN